MLRTVVRIGLGLLVVVLVVTQSASCDFGVSSNTPSASVSLPPDDTSTVPVTQSVPPLPPPQGSTTASLLPSMTLPDPPTKVVVPTEIPTETAATILPTETVSPPVVEPPEGAEKIVINDPAGDMFDARGQQISAVPYLDIVQAEIHVAETGSFFRMVLSGNLPSELDDSDPVLEWDFLIDADMNSATGWADSLIANDIGPDYLLRLVMTPAGFSAELHNFNTDEIKQVDYKVVDNTVSISVPASMLTLEQFNVTVATRAWRAGEIIAADKAPNQGHYNMPNGYINIKPGLPTMRLDAIHAVIWYNEGNDERARLCADAFEAAYADIMQTLEPPAPVRATIYVYVSQADLVIGLQEYNDISIDEAERYRSGGAPRPVMHGNYVHIPPDFDWRDIYHQQVLGAMDLICG